MNKKLVFKMLAVMGAASAALPASATYRFTDLGTLSGGYTSHAFGLNDRGDVVGSADTDDGSGSPQTHAFLWSGGQMTDLGTLGGTSSGASSINNAGQIAGYSNTTGNLDSHAVVWFQGSQTDLGRTGGAAINSTGQVAGNTFYYGSSPGQFGKQTATLWTGGVATDLGALESVPTSYAYGINDKAQVVGYSYVITPGVGLNQRATLWYNGQATNLGSLGLLGSRAYDINNAGDIVGWFTTLGGNLTHAALWSSLGITDLGCSGTNCQSHASSINDAGIIVGGQINTQEHAVMWDRLGNMTDLNSLLDAQTVADGWVLQDATGINADGWIVGSANNTNTGEVHAFLLAVPEPSALAMLMSGMGLLGFVARRRQKATAGA